MFLDISVKKCYVIIKVGILEGGRKRTYFDGTGILVFNLSTLDIITVIGKNNQELLNF